MVIAYKPQANSIKVQETNAIAFTSIKISINSAIWKEIENDVYSIILTFPKMIL